MALTIIQRQKYKHSNGNPLSYIYTKKCSHLTSNELGLKFCLALKNPGFKDFISTDLPRRKPLWYGTDVSIPKLLVIILLVSCILKNLRSEWHDMIHIYTCIWVSHRVRFYGQISAFKHSCHIFWISDWKAASTKNVKF